MNENYERLLNSLNPTIPQRQALDYLHKEATDNLRYIAISNNIDLTNGFDKDVINEAVVQALKDFEATNAYHVIEPVLTAKRQAVIEFLSNLE